MFRLWTVAAVVGLLGVGAAGGQTAKVPVRGGGPGVPLAAGAMPADVASALREMAGLAGVIFAGRVEGVSRQDAAGFVDVTFRVEQAVKGCVDGASYVVREWAGLWSGGVERYRAGERRLMLLAARGASGMSAPVAGMDGAIPLVGTGMQPIMDTAGKVAIDDGKRSDATAGTGVDLRWIAARVLRGSVGTVRSVAKSAAIVKVVGDQGAGSTGGGGAAGEDAGWSGPVAPLKGVKGLEGGVGSVPASLGSVLAVLRGGSGGA